MSRLLDILCHGERATMTSPSGEVTYVVCDGWCGSWRLSAGGYTVSGWLLARRDPWPYISRTVELLRADLRLAAVAEIESLSRILAEGR